MCYYTITLVIVCYHECKIGETFTQLSGDLVKAHKQFREKEVRFEKDRVRIYIH